MAQGTGISKGVTRGQYRNPIHSGKKFGERVPPNSRLVLVGGGALALLGSPRLTIDNDFIGEDIHPVSLHKTLMQIAKELKIHVEPVPLDRFIPLHARKYDFDPNVIEHLQELRNRLQ